MMMRPFPYAFPCQAAMKLALATLLAAPLLAALVAPVASPQVSKWLLVRSPAVPGASFRAFASALEFLFAVMELSVAHCWPRNELHCYEVYCCNMELIRRQFLRLHLARQMS